MDACGDKKNSGGKGKCADKASNRENSISLGKLQMWLLLVSPLTKRGNLNAKPVCVQEDLGRGTRGCNARRSKKKTKSGRGRRHVELQQKSSAKNWSRIQARE